MENYSLSDIASISRGNGFGESWVLILLFAMIFGGGGFGFGSRGGEQYATTSDVQRGFDTQDINSQLRGITNGISDLGYAMDNKVEGAKDFLSASIGSTKDAVITEGRGLQSQIADCCCTTQRNIDSVRFDMANYNAQTNATIHEEAEKTRNLLQTNKIENLQAQINQLQLQNALCGVPKTNPYMYGISPMYNGCNCGNI